MAIQNIHKSAILKLVNSLTTTNPVSSLNNNNNHNITKNNVHCNDNNVIYYQDIPNIQLQFDEPQTIIDLSVLTRLGYIISKFEQYFRPNSLIINGNFSKSMNNQNLFYLQQITLLIQSIENNNLLKVKLENDIEQQSLQQVQMLVLLIRDWMSQFYLNKSFIHELFPSTTTNDGTTLFSLMEIKENNIIIISLLIFNIFYRLRNSFTEYSLLLEFSWICFTDLEPYINLANFDQEYIYNILQSSLLTAHIEEEQEQQINSSLYKQIDMLNNKIVESKKRMLSLDVTTTNKQLQGSTNYNKSSSTTMKNIQSDLLTSKSSLKINQSSSSMTDNLQNHRPSSSSTLVNLYSGSKVFQQQQQSIDQQQQQRDDKPNDMKRVDRPYKCDVCMKTFPTSYKLNRHSYSHSGERPYMCTWPNCDKRFNDNYHLRRHMNTHTGEKPYPCKYPDCPKRYSRSEDLRNHQKTHCIITTQQLVQSQQQQQQQQSMNVVQTQQHQQTAVSSSLLLQQQSTPSNTSNNIVQQLVRQQQAGISMTHQPSSPVAKSPAASTTGHQQHQQHQHHRMAQQQLQQSTDLQLLNQLQQHMQQNYSSSVNLAQQQQQEHHMVSSPPNQGTTNPQQQQQQNQSAANMQQHLTENYF